MNCFKLAALLGLLTAVGCQPTSGPTPVGSQSPPAVDSGATPTDVSSTVPTTGTAPLTDTDGQTAADLQDNTPPDNSAINSRDQDQDAKTPLDQSEDPADIKITSDIRKQVVAQPDFSIDAQNIKIITAEGKVTLRGPVSSNAEKDTIEKIALEIAGEGNVSNQLDVAAE